MNTDILDQIGTLLLLGGIPALILFVIFYAVRSPWHLLQAGRSLMYFVASLLGTSVIILLSLFLGPEYECRELLRIVVYGTVAFTSWRLFFALINIQNQPPPVPREEGTVTRSEEEIV